MQRHAGPECRPRNRKRSAPVHADNVDIKIADSFLPEAADRLVIYKRLALAATCEEVDRLQAETEDRFGHLPASVGNLFEMGRLRLLAESAGVQSVDLVEDRLQLRFHERPAIEPQRILELLARRRGTLSPSGRLTLPAPPRSGDRIGPVAALLREMLGQREGSRGWNVHRPAHARARGRYRGCDRYDRWERPCMRAPELGDDPMLG